MNTPYSTSNQKFTDRAHIAAQTLIYPLLFQCPTGALAFESVEMVTGDRGKIYDGEMAIDKLVSVTVDGLRGPLVHAVQERFRRAEYAHYRDITITEWNRQSDLPSELYKLKAGIFLYGYFDGVAFISWLAVNTTALIYKIGAKEIAYKDGYNPRSDQDFLCFKFADLLTAQVVIAGGG